MKKSLNLKKKKLILSNASLKDSKFLFNLYNLTIKRKISFSKNTINYKNHLDWFKKKRDEKLTFIIKKKQRIGYIRYKYKNHKYYISIVIRDKFKNCGYGKIAFFKSLKMFKKKKTLIIAKVKKNNMISKIFFLKCGFKQKKINEFLYNFNK